MANGRENNGVESNLSKLSDHSSLEDEYVFLGEEDSSEEEDDEAKNKMKPEDSSKAQEGNKKSKFKAIGNVLSLIAKGNRHGKQKKTVAEALQIAGGVAVAGASWTADKEKLTDFFAAQKKKSKFKTGANAALIAANGTRHIQKRKTVAEALKIAGGVAIAGASWTADREKLTSAIPLEYTQETNVSKDSTIAKALYTAAAVGIACAAWTPDKSKMKKVANVARVAVKAKKQQEPPPSVGGTPQPYTPDPLPLVIPAVEETTFVDTSTSPIPELIALLRPQTANSVPYGRGETPYWINETPVEETPPLYRNFSVASARATTPRVEATKMVTPAPSIPEREESYTPVYTRPQTTVEEDVTNHSVASAQAFTPPPIIFVKSAAPSPDDDQISVPPHEISTPAYKVTTPTPVPRDTPDTEAVVEQPPTAQPSRSPSPEVRRLAAAAIIHNKRQASPTPVPSPVRSATPPVRLTPPAVEEPEVEPEEISPQPVNEVQQPNQADRKARRKPLATLSLMEKINAKAKLTSAATSVATMQQSLARWTNKT